MMSTVTPQISTNLITPAQLAEQIGMSVHTVRSWVRTGRVAHVRIGRRIGLEPSVINQVRVEVNPRADA